MNAPPPYTKIPAWPAVWRPLTTRPYTFAGFAPMHLDAGDEVCVRDEYLCVNGVRQFLHGRRVRDPGIPEVEACAFCGAPLDLNDFDHGRDPSESTLVEEMDDLECQACDAPVKGCTVVMWNRVQRVLKAGGIKVRRAS